MFKTRTKVMVILVCFSFLLLCSTLVFCSQTQNFGGNVDIIYTAPKESNFLTYTNNSDGTLTVSGWDKTLAEGQTEIIIPSTHDGKQVTAIANSAFRSASQFTSLKLSDGLKTIGSSAFAGCNLSGELIFPEGLESIGSYCFEYGGSGVTKIVIPSTLKILDMLAFEDFYQLTEFEYNAINCVLPNHGVKSLGIMPAAHAIASGYEGVWCGAGRDSSGIKLTIGEKVENIPNYLFSCENSEFGVECNVKEIIFGSNITGIGKNSMKFGTGSYGDKTPTASPITEKITIDSAYVYKNATGVQYNVCGGFLNFIANNCQIKVLKSIVNNSANSNSYLNNSSRFSKDTTSDANYVIYTKV